jgi:hypothetical protein
MPFTGCIWFSGEGYTPSSSLAMASTTATAGVYGVLLGNLF